MSKHSKIRYSNSDEQKLTKAVNNFNAKVRRLTKNNIIQPELIPDKLSLKTMRNEAKNNTRADFNRELKSSNRFLKKGAETVKTYEKGLTATRWEINEIRIKNNTNNRAVARERKIAENLDATSQGKPTGLKRGEMGSIRMNELLSKKFNPDKIRKGKEWELFKRNVNSKVLSNYDDIKTADMKTLS